MRSARLLAVCVALLTASACSAFGPTGDTRPSPQPSRGRSTGHTLGVPPGHLPPLGMCRVWLPGKPPGHQARARRCGGIERSAAAGSWILYRPTRETKVVHVKVVDERRPGVVVRLRVYDAERGTLIREG
jgi:hypothetical protein